MGGVALKNLRAAKRRECLEVGTREDGLTAGRNCATKQRDNAASIDTPKGNVTPREEIA
jgi:hypothetical protein